MAAKEKGHRDTNTWEMQYGSTAEQLKNYNVTTVPPKDEWVTVSEVRLREERRTAGAKRQQTQHTVYS